MTEAKYDVSPLLARLVAAYERIDALRSHPKRRRDLKEIARELCAFFKDVLGDQGFWNWLMTFDSVDHEQIQEFLDDLDGFRDRQTEVLEQRNVDPVMRNELAVALRATIEQYRHLFEATGPLIAPAQAAQSLNRYIEKIREPVCENPTWWNVAKGLAACTTIVSLVGGITLATSTAGVVVAVIVATLALGALAAGIADDRQG